MHDGDDANFGWLMKKVLCNVPHPTPVIPGERDSDSFTRQWMQLCSRDKVAEIWERDLGATSSSLLVDPPSSIADMMAIDDGYEYGFPQQRILEVSQRIFFLLWVVQFFSSVILFLPLVTAVGEERAL